MKQRTPDFENNLLPILQGGKPQRPTLFEFAIDRKIFESVGCFAAGDSELDVLRQRVQGYAALGYDFCHTLAAPCFLHPLTARTHQTRSLNAHSYITDWASFEAFPWPDMAVQDYSILETIKPDLPEGMKLMAVGPDGILENAISLMGYDKLCYLLYDDPALVKEIFDHIGARLLTYYTIALQYDTVGLLFCNDDWGFNTHTLISPKHMRTLIFPWYRKIVEVAHRYGKPCVLHSCGKYEKIIDDIVDDIHFDARHSYEDNIVPVEQAYDDLHARISVMGGIDVNFLCMRTPEEVYRRSKQMLERSEAFGRYALGSGNSIPSYVPRENYMAMIRAAVEA